MESLSANKICGKSTQKSRGRKTNQLKPIKCCAPQRKHLLRACDKDITEKSLKIIEKSANK